MTVQTVKFMFFISSPTHWYSTGSQSYYEEEIESSSSNPQVSYIKAKVHIIYYIVYLIPNIIKVKHSTEGSKTIAEKYSKNTIPFRLVVCKVILMTNTD